MSAVIKTFKAPAASNYGSSPGYIVRLSATGGEVTICTDASVLPLGVIVSAENELGGVVAVCVSGPCKARAGTTITAGTHMALGADGDGECVPGTAGSFVVGRFAGKASAADNDWIDIIVAPFELET